MPNMLGTQLRIDDVVQLSRRRLQAREPSDRAVHCAHFADSASFFLAMRGVLAFVRNDVRKRARWILVSLLRGTCALWIGIVRHLLPQERRVAHPRSLFFSRKPRRQLAHRLAAIYRHLQLVLFRMRPDVRSFVLPRSRRRLVFVHIKSFNESHALQGVVVTDKDS